MSDADTSHVRASDPHVADVHGAASHADDHAGAHGSHGAADAEPLGPIDLAAWAYALAGAALGGVVVVVLAIAST